MFLVSTYRFLTPGKPIQSHDNIYYQYFTELLRKKNVAPGKRHIVGQCNNNDLFNKVIISHLEAEGNKHNIRHVVKMFKTIDKKYFLIVDHCPVKSLIRNGVISGMGCQVRVRYMRRVWCAVVGEGVGGNGKYC